MALSLLDGTDGVIERPEVDAVERWARKYPFVTSLTLLTGATAVAVPQARGKPDSVVLDALAKAYVDMNDNMLLGNSTCGERQCRLEGHIYM